MKHLMFATFLIGALAHRALAQPDPDPVPDPAPVTSADDIAQAADATADVAAATVPAPDAPRPSSDDIDLSALGLDPAAPAFDDKLNIYGFADVAFTYAHFVREIPGLSGDAQAFMVGNLNIYLAKNLTPRARALAEIRFTFMPNGSRNADGTFVDTTVQDVQNFSRPAQWGGIVIERAHVDYDLTDHLTIRGGRWLTPYGVWNIDHGSPAIVAAGRPFVIGEDFFPEHQTGLDLFGSQYAGGYKLDYHLTMSNGRGASDAVVDQDNKFAFGGRLEVATPWGARLGGSYYRGRYTGFPATPGALPDTYLEASYGGDAQFHHGALLLQAEVVVHERHYVSGERAAGAAGFAPDGRDTGLYALAGYRFDRLWNVMPYAYYEQERRPSLGFSSMSGVVAGLNFRPTPSLVFKLQFNGPRFDGPGLLGDNKLYYFISQAAWVF